jgi:tRNA threonylcarbamoyladenosine biosynthesis protein TsaB
MNEGLILALETSFGPVSATLANRGGAIIGSLEGDNLAGAQAETLPPLVERLFAESGARFEDLTRIAVTTGPGAFTGVRVGLAFAKGIAIASGADIVGVSTLDCLAAQIRQVAPGAPVCIVIDARRGEVFLLVEDAAGQVLVPPSLVPVLQALDVLKRLLPRDGVVSGTGAQLVIDHASPWRVVEAQRIDTSLLARRAGGLPALGYPPVPAYLREPDARLPQ